MDCCSLLIHWLITICSRLPSVIISLCLVLLDRSCVTTLSISLYYNCLCEFVLIQYRLQVGLSLSCQHNIEMMGYKFGENNECVYNHKKIHLEINLISDNSSYDYKHTHYSHLLFSILCGSNNAIIILNINLTINIKTALCVASQEEL